MTDDPVHLVSGPATAWSRVNLAEALPGVMTPLGWTFWGGATESSARGVFHRMGVLSRAGLAPPVTTDHRFIAVFHGRAAANVDWIRGMVDLMPGASADAFELQYLGAVRPGVTSRRSRRRYPAVAVKLPLALATTPGRVRRARQEADAFWRTSLAVTPPPDPRRLLAEAGRRFVAVLTEHGVATMLVQAVYERVAALATRAGHPGLETVLTSGWGETEEAALVADLWRAARGGAGVEAVVADHGYHGPGEGELSSRTWREDPAPLQDLLERYRHLDEADSPLVAGRRRAEERREAVIQLMAGLDRPWRPAARAALAGVRTYVPLREVGKAAFLQVFDVARAAARAVGEELAAADVLDQPDDVFFLTLSEVQGGLPADPRATVTGRRRQRDAHLALDLPDAWVGPAPARPRPRPAREDDEPGPAAGTVEGLGVSPGVAEGSARVVDGPEGVPDLVPGEILVCPTTDPSWAPAMLLAAGLVIDVGGALSHGAIVARELGVPCVINTRDGTARLRTGDHLRIDGTTGRVDFERHP